jgi:hypothetical protein
MNTFTFISIPEQRIISEFILICTSYQVTHKKKQTHLTWRNAASSFLCNQWNADATVDWQKNAEEIKRDRNAGCCHLLVICTPCSALK